MANSSPTARDEGVGRIAKTLLTNQDRQRSELADLLGLDSGGLSRALAGKRKWTIDDIAKMADLFEVSVSLFFEDPESIVRSRWFSPAPLVAA